MSLENLNNLKKERAILIGIHWGRQTKANFTESMQELELLADTAGLEVVDSFSQNLPNPDSATYVGKGKLQEISNLCENKKIDVLVFNNDLSPSQSRNISDKCRCNVIDRTELILDIFAKHASTKQARLQVELAQLEYAYTKLKRLWKHLSRIKGGIGFRGPGETQIEVDRRQIRKKTQILKKKLEEIENITQTKRKKRSQITSIALVGYTNAGKSTLYNKLTRESRYTADQLFATLDAKTDSIFLPSGEKVVITDTIGFIRDLPHNLINSFHATLTEVVEADLLLHVVDVSQENVVELIAAVQKVLKEIHCEDNEVLLVFNKIDLTPGTHPKFIRKHLSSIYPNSVFISAQSGEGIDLLMEKISEFLQKKKIITTIHIPKNLKKLISYIHDNAEVIEEIENFEEEAREMKICIDKLLLNKIQKQLASEQLSDFINN
jgi:GTP-binding protein HflX